MATPDLIQNTLLTMPVNAQEPLATDPERLSPWRILLIIVGGILVLLVALNLVLIGLRFVQTPEPSDPGRLMYVTTFDRYNSDWILSGESGANVIIQPATGTSSALYFAASSSPVPAYATLDRIFNSFDLRVEARWTASKGSVGLRFRIQDSGSYYLFQIDTRGMYRVVLVGSDGRPSLLSDWQRSTDILTDPDAVNQLHVIARNFLFEFYVNDQQLPLCLRGSDPQPEWTDTYSGQCKTNRGQVRPELVDQTLNNGKIGLEGSGVILDNLVIYGPR